MPTAWLTFEVDSSLVWDTPSTFQSCCPPHPSFRLSPYLSFFQHKHTHQDSGDTGALPDKTRASLKSALSVLGVSHDGLVYNGEEHNIFVLGLDAEDLREVVRFPDTTRLFKPQSGENLFPGTPFSFYARIVSNLAHAETLLTPTHARCLLRSTSTTQPNTTSYRALGNTEKGVLETKKTVNRHLKRRTICRWAFSSHAVAVLFREEVGALERMKNVVYVPVYLPPLHRPPLISHCPAIISTDIGVSTVRGVRKHLALSPRAIFPGTVSEPPEVRRAPVAPKQVLQVASPQKLFGRPADV